MRSASILCVIVGAICSNVAEAKTRNGVVETVTVNRCDRPSETVTVPNAVTYQQCMKNGVLMGCRSADTKAFCDSRFSR